MSARAHGDEAAHYTLGSLSFTSSMTLPELVARPREAARETAVLHVDPPRAMGDDEARAFVADDDTRFFVVEESSAEVTFCFPRLARFTLSSSRDRLAVAHPREVPLETVRHLLLDQVMPRLMVRAGALVLHASVVERNGRALAFVGPSGAGKSTLALTLAQRGFSVVADDALVVGQRAAGVFALPMYAGLRLHDDDARALVGDAPRPRVAHYHEKVRVTDDVRGGRTFTSSPVLLHRVFVLVRDDVAPPRVALMAPREALLTLVPAAFRFVVDDASESARVFTALTDATLLARTRALIAPHRRDVADALVAVVEGELELA